MSVQQSPKVAKRACKNEVRDDFWIAFGNCINTDDDDEARECIQEAQTEHQENRELCSEQRNAREDVCDLVGQAPYAPEIDPENFLSPAEIAANPNPYFPLIPGLVRIYEAGDETITVQVTAETKEIMGVTALCGSRYC